MVGRLDGEENHVLNGILFEVFSIQKENLGKNTLSHQKLQKYAN